MHDPNIVAFEIKAPWKRRYTIKGAKGESYRPTLVTVWHRDPETDGTDDSCGYTFPKPTKDQADLLEQLGWSEAHEPMFQRTKAKYQTDLVLAERLMRACLGKVNRVLKLGASKDQLDELALSMIDDGADNCLNALAFLPGWHCNGEEDTPEARKYHAERLMFVCFRVIAYELRPWWRKPKWHWWHWRFQVHPWQWFKRRFISRCDECGVRFKGGTAFTNWDGDRHWCAECNSKTMKAATVRDGELRVEEDES